MGGMGSGRHWHSGGKEATNNYRRLDVRELQRHDMLIPGHASAWNWYCDDELRASIQIHAEANRVILSYRRRVNGGEWKDELYPVTVDWTPCTYGGHRAWFLCPARGCGLRVAILYGGGIFACRHCFRLAYPSQRESAHDRSARRADKIRRRLSWPVGILNPIGGKPKGMHWHTYVQLTADHNALVNRSLAGIARQIGIWKARLR